MATYNGHNEDSSGNILLSIGNGMTATLETGTRASQAYAKGAYLYYNNRLCKVIAAIASGATFSVGTNVSYTSIGAELTSHLRASSGDEFYFDYQNGKYGYNTSASRGSSTFYPFKNTTDIIAALPKKITCSAYAGSGAQDEGAVNGSSTMSLVSPGNGTLSLHMRESEKTGGYVTGSASCNGVTVRFDSVSDKNLNIYEGKGISFVCGVAGLNMWERITATLSWEWHIS